MKTWNKNLWKTRMRSCKIDLQEMVIIKISNLNILNPIELLLSKTGFRHLKESGTAKCSLKVINKHMMMKRLNTNVKFEPASRLAQN